MPLATNDGAALASLGCAQTSTRYQLDGRHNWTAVTRNGAQSATTFLAADQYRRVKNVDVQHDGGGRISDVGGAALSYDPFGNLISISTGGETVTLKRDAFDRVVESVHPDRTVRYGHAGSARVAQREEWRAG